MTKPRSNQVSLEATPYYHVTSRCVRKAFLCGYDRDSHTSYEHRREWVESRIAELAEIFCIDIAAYAVMSNHYHIVVHINQANAFSLDNDQIIERWHKLFKLPDLINRQRKGETLTKSDLYAIDQWVQDRRSRLYCLSWFMRCLNEPLARMANEEEDCKGRFWEGRYKSQALLDEAALFTCMSYVDLNPIRAQMANTPEESDYTSIQSRIKSDQTHQKHTRPVRLQHFIGNERQVQAEGIPFSLHDYLQLVDYSGRAILENKRGAIPSHLSPILSRLGINQDNWLDNVSQFEQRFNLVVGTIERLKEVASQLKQKWIKGASSAKQLYLAKPT